ncbi:Hect ubiquitin ligase, partial [Globisporangium splendens]
MEASLLLALLSLGLIAVFAFSCWYQCHRANVPLSLHDLRVPLLPINLLMFMLQLCAANCFGRTTSAAGHRLQLALKCASDGYRRCGFCGFENFKRLPFCCLCGESVAHIPAQSGLDKSASFPQAIPPDEGSFHDGGASVNTSQRHKRAKNRKEWMRKVDATSELYWCRQVCCKIKSTTETHPRPTGYAFAFIHPHGPATTVYFDPQSSSCDAVASESSSREFKIQIVVDPQPPCLLWEIEGEQLHEDNRQVPPKPEYISKSALIARLDQGGCDSTKYTLTPSSLADPMQFPIFNDEEASPSKQHLQDTLRIADQDFPTKFAHFVTTTAGLCVPATQERITLHVRRDHLVADSVESLSLIPREHIRSAMRIHFVGERGLDAGGLHREWLLLLNQSLADESTGVFRCVDAAEQTFYLNPNSAHDIGDDHLAYFLAAGCLIGRSLLEGHVLGFHLALPLLKLILGLPVSFNDLEYFDSEAYKSMLWILASEDIESLGLTLSLMDTQGDRLVEVDLIEDGRDIAVTQENKELYLERRFQYLLFESVSSQLYAFLKGVYDVIPQELLLLFDPEEFDYLLCGSDEIDVDDWQRNAQWSDNLRDHDVLRWFWEIVREMPNEHRRRLLHFATGSSRVPIAGFSALTSLDGRLYPFTLKGVSLEENEYIWSHACFNQLDLPLFATRAKLSEALSATLDTDTHGIISIEVALSTYALTGFVAGSDIELKNDPQEKKEPIAPVIYAERQKRVRKRKEWQRKLDLPVPLALEAVVKTLNDEAASFALVLTESPLLSPAQMPVQDTNADQQALQWPIALLMASRDFPTKYTEFVSQAAPSLAPATSEDVRLSVLPINVLDDSMQYLSFIPRRYIRSAMRVYFLDETGVDAGGLHREWFALLDQKLPDHLTESFDAPPDAPFRNGKVIRRALLEGQILDFHLPLPLIKIIFGLLAAVSDMEHFDPETYKNLLWIMENDIAVASLQLDFTMTERRGSKIGVVDLIEGGRDINVTNDNKALYLDRMFRYLVFESVSSQLYAFLKGVFEVVPQELLVLLDTEEFDYLLCGSDTIDVDDWQRHTVYSDNLKDHDVQAWF